jgi:predicted NodU family carbamoyl transferase
MASNKRRKFRRGKPANTIKSFNTPNRDLLKATKKVGDLLDQLKAGKSKINKINNKMVNISRDQYLMNTLRHGANEFPGQNLTNPNPRIDPLTTILGKPLTTNMWMKPVRLAIGAAKTAKNLGAALALNYLSDRFLSPHVNRAGVAIGEAMKRRHIEGQKRKKKKK